MKFNIKFKFLLTLLIAFSLFTPTLHAGSRIGTDGSGQGWFGEYPARITNSNGKSWAATGANIDQAIWDLNGTGGVVWVPEGTYHVGNITLSNGVSLIGQSGSQNVTIYVSVSPGIEIWGEGNNGVNGVVLKNIHLLEEPGSTVDIGLQLYKVHGAGALIENVVIGNDTGAGLGFESTNIDHYCSRYVTYINVISRNSSGDGLHVRGIGGDESNCNTWINCHFAHNNHSNVQIQENTNENTFIGGVCQFANNSDGMWVLSTAGTVNVYGMVFEGNARYGLQIDGGVGHFIRCSTNSNAVRGLDIANTNSSTFFVRGFNTAANTILLAADVVGCFIGPTVCPVTDNGVANVVIAPILRGMTVPTSAPFAPMSGSVYWDEANSNFMVYNATSVSWMSVTLT